VTAREIVDAALAMDPAERAAYVRQQCGGNRMLLAEADALLVAHTAVTASIAVGVSEGLPGSPIGPYKLMRQLGEGGMGVVYHAQQTHPLRRDVALKVIKPGMDSRQVIARFESERQALALMDHPHIARVFDAGATTEGRPYFAMELVDGVPITKYCDAKRMTVEERIALFIPVCQAIQHAHQKGIIHRDIKPSNLLVAEREGRPVAKVIDFGLAKALGHQLSDATMMTNVGMVVGTLEYMSPEQAELTRQDIDTRSDVYSLGAVLYELLTGATPLAPNCTETVGYVDTLQRIREEEPAHPSARVRRSAISATIAAQRRVDASRLPKLLHGELDWIVMKALEKDRSRRYETVNGLARDLERYLAGNPVEAGPRSTAYRLRKFAGRHGLGLAIAAAFIVLLVGGAVVSTWMAVRARRAESEARAISDFLRQDVMAQASADTQARPDTKPDPDLKVRTALDRAATRIEGKFANQPLVEASIRQTIGNTYDDLGLYPEALRQLERALELRRRELGEEHPDTLASMFALGWVYQMTSKYDKAEPLLARTLEVRRRVLGESHSTTLSAMSGLGFLYERQGKYAKAEPLLLESLELQRRTLGEENINTVTTQDHLSVVYARQGKYSQAEALQTQVLASVRRLRGDEHPSTLTSMVTLGGIYYGQKKYTEAEDMYRRVYEIDRRVLGEEHENTILVMSNLVTTYTTQGKYTEAEPLTRKMLEISRRVFGEEHRRTIQAAHSSALLYVAQGRYGLAESLLSRAAGPSDRVLGKEHPMTLEVMSTLAEVYQKQDRLVEADALFVKVLEAQRRVLGQDHGDTLSTQTSLNSVWLQQKRDVEAERGLRDALKLYEKASPELWERYYCQGLLGASLAGQKKFAEAEPLLVSGYEGMAQREAGIPFRDRSRLAEAGNRIVKLYQDWGRPEKAAEWNQELKQTRFAASPN